MKKFFRFWLQIGRNIGYIWKVEKNIEKIKQSLDELELKEAASRALLVNMRHEQISKMEHSTIDVE